jgi:hypothetical protein
LPHTTQDIKDAEDGKKLLLSTRIVAPEADFLFSQLVDATFHISTMQGVPKHISDALRAVGFIMRDTDLRTQSIIIASAVNDRLEELYVDPTPPLMTTEHLREVLEIQKKETLKEMAKQLDARLDELKKELTDTAGVIKSSTSDILATTTSYRDAILKNAPAAPSQALKDPKATAQEDTKAKQILINIVDKSALDNLSRCSSVQLIEMVNKALHAAGFGSEERFLGLTRLANGGFLFAAKEIKTIKTLLASPEGFLTSFSPAATIQQRSYSTIAYFVPLSLRPDNPQDISEIEQTNCLPERAISQIKWVKPPERRAPSQMFGHVIINFCDPEQANNAIAKGLFICRKRVDVAKNRREPLHCLKCQKWGHMASACPMPTDICGGCGRNHKTVECTSRDKFCTPCNVQGHPSWDRECPTFIRRKRELDEHTPENVLPYFPTDEPWTRTAAFNSSPSQFPQPSQARYSTDANTANTAQQANLKRTDTYFPAYLRGGRPPHAHPVTSGTNAIPVRSARPENAPINTQPSTQTAPSVQLLRPAAPAATRQTTLNFLNAASPVPPTQALAPQASPFSAPPSPSLLTLDWVAAMDRVDAGHFHEIGSSATLFTGLPNG